MTGLMAAQIRITGDLEKDQQLLIYGIGGLIGLIVLAMIVILVVVLVRRGKASRLAAAQQPVPVPQAVPATPPQEDTYKPAAPAKEEPAIAQEEPVAEPVSPPEPQPEVKQQPEQETKAERKSVATPSANAGLVVPENDAPAQPEEKEEKKDAPKYDFGAYKDELAQQNPDDKMEEIRRRLEEIKRQRQTEPAPVLPKVEAKLSVAEIRPTTETGDNEPLVPEEEVLAEEEIDETRLLHEEPEDPETVPVTEVPQVEHIGPAQPQMPGIPDEITSDGEMAEPEEPTAEGVPTEQPAGEDLTEEEPVEREEIRSGGETYYTVPNEPVMELQRDPQPAPAEPAAEAKTAQPETGEIRFPNGKFLPMKKLTFAEWVELFKVDK